METTDRKDLASIDSKPKPRKRKKTSEEITEDEIRVINVAEMQEVEEEDVFLEDPDIFAPEKTISVASYLRNAVDSLKRDDGRLVCVIRPVQTAGGSIAELFISFLHRTMSRVNDMVEQKTGISILSNTELRNRIVGDFDKIRKILYTLNRQTHMTGTINDYVDWALTFETQDIIRDLFQVLGEKFGIDYRDITLYVPKSSDRLRQTYRNFIGGDGFMTITAPDWNPGLVSCGFMTTYLSFIETKTYGKNLPDNVD